MEEREITDVTPIGETDWSDDVGCMSAKTDMSGACGNSADKELSVVYEDEPEKTFFSCLCKYCANEYLRKWDAAQIYGDDYIEDDNDYRIQ